MRGILIQKRNVIAGCGIVVVAFLLLGILGCGGDDNLAEVGGRSISKSQFETFLDLKRIPKNDNQRRNALLKEYLEREALAQAIEKTNVLDKDRVAAEVNEYRKNLLINRYFEKYLSDKLSDDALQRYYDEHLSDFEETRAHVAQILIRTRASMTKAQLAEKERKVRQAHDLIKNGMAFSEVAETFSEDQSTARRGGDMGWIKQGRIAKAFSEVVFSLEPGTVSEPFRSPFGYHIVTVLEAPRAKAKPFKIVAADIAKQLRAELRQKEYQRLLDKAGIKTK